MPPARLDANASPHHQTGTEANVTRAWTENPISDLLRRLPGTAPRVDEALSAALAPGLAR